MDKKKALRLALLLLKNESNEKTEKFINQFNEKNYSLGGKFFICLFSK